MTMGCAEVISKPIAAGVMRARLPASAKNGKTRSRGSGTVCLARSTPEPALVMSRVIESIIDDTWTEGYPHRMERASEEPRYPVRMVIKRTGLTADLLRAWERRYGVVKPQRSEGGQRLYSEDDIVRLGMLKRATVAGHSIGEV